MNTSAHHQRRALNSELTALYYFINKNHRLLYHRKKIFGVEIDLILHDRDCVQLVEVKTYTNLAMLSHRLTQKQKNRLQFAKSYFESSYGLPTQLILATVKGEDVDDFIIG